ncbi:nitric oxide reductase activation-like protein [Romboutsia sedimentorum]|uniref:Nitric oxide reductase activation-like protein n=1 Tax=Romboutsia sedimentorum TaxID=1368474 RepID=A0ABT7EAU7_9FIRM|nr:nitric oxide reductase activation-like protein [Romboutsia sedimentorum]MDK2564048.1 nitric oxide reductase activation-like protein [Romboutsia sedimentorum]MDK2585589.1 nitric oxide reductase activation-like protein [Romboutsia sedimentorum]
MKWIYEDFEFENRLNNLSWTICGDYNVEIENDENDYLSKNVALYYSINAGARRTYIDFNTIKKYLNSRVKSGLNKEVLIKLVQICSDVAINDKIIQERPGVYDIRKKAYQDIISNYFKIKDDTVLDKIKYTLILENMDKHPIVSPKIRKIINDIKKAGNCNNTLDLLKIVEDTYNTHFGYIVSELEESHKHENNRKNTDIDFDTFSDFMNEELYSDDSEVEEIMSSRIVDSIGEGSILDNKTSSNRKIYIDEENVAKIYTKIEYYYGKSFLDKEEIKKLERINCRDIHEGCRVHLTDGVLRSECENIFQIKYVTRQKEKNLSVYRDDIKIYKRNIKKLKDNIGRMLIKEQEKDIIHSDNGNLVANKLWKVGKSQDNKVFYKNINNDKGRYVVDILLDSSGSQRRNQGKVSAQGYIVSQALTQLGISNRVMGYCSFLDYTIIRRFRDYNSPISFNENIFEYFCAGNNRDGLAIKSVYDGLLKREEENKIMIILSDGKPNDVKVGKESERTTKSELSYKGIVGIRDSASEVRKARKQGIKVLGIFTGKEEDLEAEKLIYGRDFVYINNIDRFADVISMYLKRIIEV